MEHPPAALAPALPLQPQTPGVWKDCHARRTKARPATPRPIPPVAEARACYEFSAAMAAAGAPLSRGSDSSPLPKVKTSTAPSTKPPKKLRKRTDLNISAMTAPSRIPTSEEGRVGKEGVNTRESGGVR